MVRTELKVQYKNSVLGFAWSLLNPLLYLVVFYIAFDLILGAGIPAFPLFLLSGLLVWNLFSAGLGAATGSVVGNAGLVKKVSFPREILPLASIGAMLVHFFLQCRARSPCSLVVRWDVAWAYIPLLPLALVALLLLTAGLGILLGSINVYLRDTQHFLELALLAWFWMTPIVYGFMTIGSRGGWGAKVYMLNPITPIVLIVPARALREDRQRDAPAGGSARAQNAAGRRSSRTGRGRTTSGTSATPCVAGIILFTIGSTCSGASRRTSPRSCRRECRDRGPRRLEALPALPRALLVVEGDASSTSGASRSRTSGPRDDINFEVDEGIDRRHPRAQRLGQVDAAEVHRRASCSRRAARSSRAGAWPRCSSSVPASTRSSPGARTSS